MPTIRWRPLVALLSLAVLANAAHPGETHDKSKTKAAHRSCSAGIEAPAMSKLVKKTYPVADLVKMTDYYGLDGDLLVRTILSSVRPKSWVVAGGSGTIEYHAATKSLVVRQTSTVHKQVRCVLQALTVVHTAPMAAPKMMPEVVQASCISATTSPCCPACKTPAPDHRKQYGHFILDNVRVNAMGVSCTIKKIRFQYKGDGIDPDVAKCALTNGESEKKTMEAPKALTDFLEKMEKMSEGTKTPSCSMAPPSLVVPAVVNFPVSAKPMETPDSPSKAEEKKTESSDKVEKGKAKPE